MTDSECNAVGLNSEAPSVTQRKLTVSYASRYPSYARIPSIIMKGQWLATAGFTTGTEVSKCHGGPYCADRETTRAGR